MHKITDRRLFCHLQHVHFLGIGGTGMLPLAMLASQSMKVTGWDDHQNSSCEYLQSVGVATKLSLAGSTFPDTVVASAAIDRSHAELQLARYGYRCVLSQENRSGCYQKWVRVCRKKGMVVMSRQEWFQASLKSYRQVAVAGSHGKTTTTALSAFLLHQLVSLD